MEEKGSEQLILNLLARPLEDKSGRKRQIHSQSAGGFAFSRARRRL